MTEPNDPFDNTLPEYKEEIAPPPKFQLNEGQQWAHDRTVQYITGEGENLPRIILIRGFAGTGKTFTLNRIINTSMIWSDKQTDYSKKLSIAASAPTHKAVRVMRKNAELGEKVTYTTIHSLLGLKPEPDNKTGKQVFKRSTDPEDGKIQDYNLVIVDEVSMLGEELWEALMIAVSEGRIKLILLGDPCQIPPVKEKDTVPFLKTEEFGIEVVELTQSMRQIGDNPILDYATALRTTYKQPIKVNPAHFAKINADGHGIKLLSATDINEVDRILEGMFGSDKFRADADYMKVVAWSNARSNPVVDSFNKKIRRMLYIIPDGMLSLPMIVHGEKLIMNDRYIIPNTQGMVLPNNEEIEVVSYEVVRKGMRYKLWSPMGYQDRTLNPQFYQAIVRYKKPNGGWTSVTIYIVHESSTIEVNTMLEDVKASIQKIPFSSGNDRREMWNHWWSLYNATAKIAYNYAITAHKSQGSTYENCMLILWNINANPNYEERNRITYTGATRAKHMLYIIQ